MFCFSVGFGLNRWARHAPGCPHPREPRPGACNLISDGGIFRCTLPAGHEESRHEDRNRNGTVKW